MQSHDVNCFCVTTSWMYDVEVYGRVMSWFLHVRGPRTVFSAAQRPSIGLLRHHRTHDWHFTGAVALTFSRRYKSSDWRFSASAIYVRSSMCSENTKHLWYKYYGLFVRMYITSQLSYSSQINTRQTSFEAYCDSKRKSHDCSAL